MRYNYYYFTLMKMGDLQYLGGGESIERCDQSLHLYIIVKILSYFWPQFGVNV